ncbi:MAG: aldehyde ferredoxin oxidoreductase N-terminal domain-containing protein [Patescibacteria group bacterium]
MKVLFVDLTKKKYYSEEVEVEQNGIIDLGLKLHFDQKTYQLAAGNPKNLLIFGAGPFNFGGANRGVFVFRSPVHGGIHSSTLGDAGTFIKKTGFDALVFLGRSAQPCFLIIDEKEVVFRQVPAAGNVFKLEKIIFNQLKSEGYNVASDFRIALAGSLAAKLPYGVIVFSKPNQSGRQISVAGRGGVGSVMIQSHNLSGFAFGGDCQLLSEKLPVSPRVAIEATEKYRQYGTKANFCNLKENLPMFNWSTFSRSVNLRKRLHQDLIEDQFLLGLKTVSATCGESCLATCRKQECGRRLDYEPYESMGPLIGVFDRGLTRKLVMKADSLGLDIIYFGNILSAVLEAGAKGKLDLKKLFGVSYRSDFDFGKKNWKGSKQNYLVADGLINDLIKNPKSLLLGRISQVAKRLSIEEFAFYLSYQNGFDMVPNIYRSLGLYLPIAMPGKYFSDYQTKADTPVKYAKICAQKGMDEYQLDNLGLCRFHRGWLVDVLKKQPGNPKQGLSKLIEYRRLAKADQVLWQSPRMIQTVKDLLAENKLQTSPKQYYNVWTKTYRKFFADFS